jgi:hypothetical protein
MAGRTRQAKNGSDGKARATRVRFAGLPATVADATPRTPEKLYTLAELAELTGRSANFWGCECKSGRLEHMQRVPNGTVLIPASAYDAWFLSSLDRTAARRARCAKAAAEPSASRSAPVWIDFKP